MSFSNNNRIGYKPAVAVFPTPGAPWSKKMRPFPRFSNSQVRTGSPKSKLKEKSELALSLDNVVVDVSEPSRVLGYKMLRNQRQNHFLILVRQDEAVKGACLLGSTAVLGA